MSFWRSIYYKWLSLKIPLRKRQFMGHDLDGNTFWEFSNANSPERPRRIVQLKSTSGSYVDYKLPPQWSQWLRHVRRDPPTIEELQQEQARLAFLKHRIAAAEQRWKSVPLKTSSVSKDEVMVGATDTSTSQPESRTKKQDSSNVKSQYTYKKMYTFKKRSSDEFEPQAWSSKPLKR
ncbi:hypothetical protein V1511DRAFT_512594 [Dipodascopsis uninucleata]